MRLKHVALAVVPLTTVAWLAVPSVGSASEGGTIPHYDHIVEIMMENASYNTIIGNALAPNINQLADKHGLATNYVANVGGSFFGIQDDNQFCRPHQDRHQWRTGNNAIVITWDEDDFSDQGQPGTGCCGTDPGGGHVATIVITNHDAAHVTDGTAYNHYSLLRSLEDAFGLRCLANACDTADGVRPMTPLFGHHG